MERLREENERLKRQQEAAAGRANQAELELRRLREVLQSVGASDLVDMASLKKSPLGKKVLILRQ